MKLQILTAVAAASLALSTATSLAQTGVQGLAEREIRRQEQLKNYAEEAIAKGQQAMKNRTGR